MGVLSKPDLVIERATQQAVLDLVHGKRNDLQLGYCVVKNRDADDQGSSNEERHEMEKAFFRNDPWSKIAKSGRTGVDALKKLLRELLLAITKKEFPNVKAEILARLKHCREQHEGYGAPRTDSHAQRAYLGALSTSFQKVATSALDANYVHSQIFEDKPELKLITKIIGLNEHFAYIFWKNGHARKFSSTSGNDDDVLEGDRLSKLSPLISADTYPELDGIITEPEQCELPSSDSIMKHIQSVYDESRGPELGTVSIHRASDHTSEERLTTLILVWRVNSWCRFQGTVQEMEEDRSLARQQRHLGRS